MIETVTIKKATKAYIACECGTRCGNTITILPPPARRARFEVNVEARDGEHKLGFLFTVDGLKELRDDLTALIDAYEGAANAE